MKKLSIRKFRAKMADALRHLPVILTSNGKPVAKVSSYKEPREKPDRKAEPDPQTAGYVEAVKNPTGPPAPVDESKATTTIVPPNEDFSQVHSYSKGVQTGKEKK